MKEGHFVRTKHRLFKTSFLYRKALRHALFPRQPQLAVFVAGAQRSGTNMMMDVLERSMETDVYHEHDSRAFVDYRMKPVEKIRRLQHRSRASHFVIKALLDLHRLPALMETFAPAKTLWLLRNYNDVVNSMRVSFSNQAAQIQRVAADRTSGAWLAQGMSDRTYSLISARVDDDLDDTSAAALLWYIRNVLFFEMGFDRDPRVLLVAYEDLVSAPAEHFPEIFRFLGLRHNSHIIQGIYASSVQRRPVPLIRESVRDICENLFVELLALTRKG